MVRSRIADCVDSALYSPVVRRRGDQITARGLGNFRVERGSGGRSECVGVWRAGMRGWCGGLKEGGERKEDG